MTTRRSFLSLSIPIAAAPIVSPGRILDALATSGARGPGQQDGPTPEWVVEARRQIPATKDRFFQTAGIAPSPTPVLHRVKELLDLQNTGPVSPDVYPMVAATEPNLRAHFAETFGAEADEIALTHSTSEGINIASWSINWREGDEVVISNQEHPANTIPWYNLATRFGIVVRRIDLSTGTDLLDEVGRVLNSRTRMISIPHVSRNNGRRLRTAESGTLGAMLRERGVRYHLDGAQGPGCVPVDFGALGCDYYSACGHKWLLGPKGTGAFFCRREILDDTRLTWTGAHSTTGYDQAGNYELLPEARRFEFGTRALADFGGFDAALSWMQQIGMERVLHRVDELVTYAANAWRGRGHRVTSPTADEERSGVFVLRLPNESAGRAVYDALRDDATFTSPVDDPSDLRLAIHFFNTEEEINETFDAIEALGPDK